MKNRKYSSAFTILELVVTMMVATILIMLATSSIINALPRMHIRGDSWNIYQALVQAKFLTINDNRPYGVAFVKNCNAAHQDCFFVFKDWNGNGIYDDTDNNPLFQCNPADPATGPSCHEDPIVGTGYENSKDTTHQHVPITFLDASDSFVTVFGTNMKGTATIAWVTFTTMGSVSQSSAVNANPNIEIENSKITGGTDKSYHGGVTLNAASGTASRMSIIQQTKI
jgi:hypothetical protein